MGRAMEVGRGGQTQANEGEEGSDRVYDQDRRQRLACTGRQIELIAGTIYILCREGLATLTTGRNKKGGAD